MTLPYLRWQAYSGKLVRVDLKNMDDDAACLANYRQEFYSKGSIQVQGPASSADACVFIIDLATLHPLARGFRRGLFCIRTIIQLVHEYLSCGLNIHSTLKLSIISVCRLMCEVRFRELPVRLSLGGRELHLGASVDMPPHNCNK